MKQFLYIAIFFLGMVSCNKETEPEGPVLPAGATAFTEAEIAFVPNGTDDKVYKKSPDFTSELILNYKERLATEQVFAWDQTFFSFNVDPGLEVEFRLRYIQVENEYHKSLAIYMPYRDVFGTVRTNIFETPINETAIETGFFSELVTFHSSIEINGTEWSNVYEIIPLTSTDPALDNESNFSKVYYNATFGIIQMDQKNGDIWILHL